MSVPENYDANDVEQKFGLEKVREAFSQRRSTLPPTPPYDGEGQHEARTLDATPFAWRNTEDIPPRQWLYGTHLIRKFLSLDIAAGGIGKSSLKVVEALAMTTGRDLLGKQVHGGPLNVWLYNLEDPDEETERRIHAAADRYEITPEDVGSRLFVNSGRDQPLVIAEETDSGARIMRPVVDALIKEIKWQGIDVLILDPFVSSHMVSENDNRAIDMVAKEWSRIADVCNCSINLVHHVRKQNGGEVSAESSRGAISLIGAARSVIVYNRMSEDEAVKAGVNPETRGFYFRTQNDKANLAPAESADWHRMNNVDLPNGDKVGVACSWKWPDAFDGVSHFHMREVQSRIGMGKWREDPRSKDKWAGNVIAEVLDIDIDDKAGKARVLAILKQWIKTDVLRVYEDEDGQRHTRKFVEVGQWQGD